IRQLRRALGDRSVNRWPHHPSFKSRWRQIPAHLGKSHPQVKKSAQHQQDQGDHNAQQKILHRRLRQTHSTFSPCLCAESSATALLSTSTSPRTCSLPKTPAIPCSHPAIGSSARNTASPEIVPGHTRCLRPFHPPGKPAPRFSFLHPFSAIPPTAPSTLR